MMAAYLAQNSRVIFHIGNPEIPKDKKLSMMVGLKQCQVIKRFKYY